MPVHLEPREEEVKSQRCLSTSTCMLLYWLPSDGCCTQRRDVPDICYLSTCYPLPRSEWVSQHRHPGSFHSVVEAPPAFQRHQTSSGKWCETCSKDVSHSSGMSCSQNRSFITQKSKNKTIKNNGNYSFTGSSIRFRAMHQSSNHTELLFWKFSR